MSDKAAGAFLTIGELADVLDLPQHILRYWETRFPQLRPLQRAGKRRYYRPEDVALAKTIDRLLNREGYTIRGVQMLLAGRGGAATEPAQPEAANSDTLLPELKRLRAALAEALAAA